VPRKDEWFPQFNWPVFGPLIVALALIVGVSGLIWSLSITNRSDASDRAAGGRVPGTGGGVELRAPDAVRSKLFSLSARVNGTPTIRRGPGTQYEVVSRANDGQEFHVIACSPGCEWLRLLSLTDEGQWWLPAVFLSVSGKVEQLPVLSPAEPAGR
jgi:hypothetical protein